MITLRTAKDGSEFDFTTHTVTVDGARYVFGTLHEAWEFIFRSKKKGG